MKRYLAYIIFAVMLLGCGQIRQIPVQTQTIVNYRDSLVIRDSVRLISLPVESEKDYSRYPDTLYLETSLAGAKTWLDTSANVLRGEIHNKPVAKIPVPVKEHTVYRDSLVYKEVPVEVVKEVKTHYGYEKWLWGYVVVSLLVIALYILLKKKRFSLVS